MTFEHPCCHELKCWPSQFQAIVRGDKRHEFRRNDRDFQEFDLLLLKEWDPLPVPEKGFIGEPVGYTGREALVMVTHMGNGAEYGIPDGFVVLSIAPLGDYRQPPPVWTTKR